MNTILYYLICKSNTSKLYNAGHMLSNFFLVWLCTVTNIGPQTKIEISKRNKRWKCKSNLQFINVHKT